ncbi:MAG: hypothetical protein H6Q74_2777 [Firmicutes bacterium]|nr:hypothetical protein [Bacillota bacterium]
MEDKRWGQSLELQLFAAEAAATDTAVELEAPDSIAEPEEQGAAEQFAIELKNGQRRVVRVPEEVKPRQENPAEEGGVGKEPSNEEPPQAELAKQAEPTDRPPEYTVEEITVVNDISKLDPNRIPEALRGLYTAMVAGISRKFQEVAGEKKALQEMADSLRKQDAKEAKAKPSEVYEAEAKRVKDTIAKMFGVDLADLPEATHDWPQAMQDAYNDGRAFLRQQRQARETKEQQAKQQQGFVRRVFDELKAADAEAFEYAVGKIQNKELLEKDSQEVAQALLKGDKEPAVKLFNRLRDEFRGVEKSPAEEPKQPPKAPALEKSGKQIEQPKPNKTALDAAFFDKFKTASPQDKVKMIGEWRRRQGG